MMSTLPRGRSAATSVEDPVIPPAMIARRGVGLRRGPQGKLPLILLVLLPIFPVHRSCYGADWRAGRYRR